ncbi:transporter [Hallella bergensis]|uniref:transporter n=1 Tax=Hallella bergensis TaxID=242750 RepID=UPI0023F438C3|nr:transporter [Hallella bergensis]
MDVVRFIKNWTLPVAMTTGIVAYLLFHFVPVLQPIGRWYAPYNDNVLPDFMFLILFVTFCKVDYKRLIPVKWHLWIGIQQVAFVLALVGLILGFGITGKALIMFEAVLVCIIGPAAAAAAVVTAKLGGNLEEMTTYTFVSNFISALLIPLCFPLLPQANVAVADIEFWPLFMQILWKVSMVLILPMLLAYIVKHRMHRFHRWLVGIKDLSYYMWGCSLVVVTGTTAMNIREAWEQTSVFFFVSIAFMALILCVVQFATGRFIGHYFDKTIEAGQGLGQKNTAFAIWVATAFLNPLSSVGPGCYILWQNIINSVEIWIYRKKGLEQSS